MRLLSLLLLAILEATAPASDGDLFARDAVLSFEITISADGIQQLGAQPTRNVPATVQFSNQKFSEATLHLKGHGSFRPITDKPSFSIRLYGGKLGGRKKLLLNNSSQDNSFFRWKLASELFLKAGLPAARLNFARIKLNGRDLGLYLFVEPTDKAFLNQHFGSPDGDLYEGGNNDVTDQLEVDSGNRTGDQADLKELAQACIEPNLAERWRRLNQILDVEHFLSFMALEVLICHHDGYSMDRNNFRIYHNPKTNRLIFIPHGLDLIFDRPALLLEPRFSGIVARALIDTPEGSQAYRDRVRELSRKFYGDDLLLNRLDALLNIIEPPADSEIQRGYEKLRQQIRARRISVFRQIELLH